MIEAQLLDHIEPQAYTILVVDDTPTNLKVVVDYLAGIGFHMLTARDGERGIMRAQRAQPDLILLDVMMPGLNGFETCQQLKAHETTQGIPVIFMTSLTAVEDKVMGFEVGGIDYVTKPFQQEEVLARVITQLRIRNLTQHLEQLVTKRTQALSQSLQRQQVLAQQLQQSLAKEPELKALKSQVIEVVSHEFRTPLTVISYASDLLKNYSTLLSEEKRLEQFDNIKGAIAFILKLVDDVVSINHINTLAANLVIMDLATLGEQLQTALQEQFAEQWSHINVSYPTGTAQVTTDAALVTQIVSELVANSLKFSKPPQQISVQLVTDKGKTTILVKDTGIGIPAGEKAKIFEMFSRASNVDARQGLGLGLFIAQQIATAINGRIQVESAGENQGSTFFLELFLDGTMLNLP